MFLLEKEVKLLGLTVKELHHVCEYCKIACNTLDILRENLSDRRHGSSAIFLFTCGWRGGGRCGWLGTAHVGMKTRREHTGRDSISNSCWASSSGFRKDFRINVVKINVVMLSCCHVVINKSTSKDTLSFSSLELQIESGLRKGYPEVEIVAAVIRAVNLKLRTYLEGKRDVTLATLRQMWAHYAEKDVTVLYQQLTKAVQGPSEKALDFLVRVLGPFRI